MKLKIQQLMLDSKFDGLKEHFKELAPANK